MLIFSLRVAIACRSSARRLSTRLTHPVNWIPLDNNNRSLCTACLKRSIAVPLMLSGQNLDLFCRPDGLRPRKFVTGSDGSFCSSNSSIISLKKR
ncbi:hypothetical protein FKM82_019498 [Ascaphus truei]